MNDYDGILYAIVAVDKQIVCEHNASNEDFTQGRIPPNDSKLSYAYDSESGVVFMCVARESFGRRIPFSFLLEIKAQFESRFPDPLELDISQFNQYSILLAQEMTRYSASVKADPIRQVQNDISQVKEIMAQNIERVLERGDRIDLLVDKTNNLSTEAFAFRKRSTALKRKLWWKNQKLMAMLICSLVISAYIAISAFCGFPGWSSCRAP
ncbi:Vesicle-associated membrane protein [Smittium culicis]|uniref:Synaptobrevin homolog YKT6 n=2 Tax=Smittium culicis TaxID=133412 RepID=A0A1R1XPB4_9FUNG|nr:Vesicle-associated membrane protein [Smittium culicis]